MNAPRHIALLLAGGTGERMKAAVPKQFLEVDGETILEHTMQAFEHHALIHDIYVVAAPEWLDKVRALASRSVITKLRDVIQGGVTGFDSCTNGIRHLLASDLPLSSVILVHDAVRPLVTQDIISRNIAVCLTHGNAITAQPSHEAFLLTSDGFSSDRFLPREGLLSAQTPHTFTLDALRQLFAAAEAKGITQSQSLFTFAAELALTPLYIAEGDIRNLKITDSNDLLVYMALKKALL